MTLQTRRDLGSRRFDDEGQRAVVCLLVEMVGDLKRIIN